MKMCEHHACRCAAAAKLAAMGLIREAIKVHFSRVRCLQEKEVRD